MSVLWEDAHTWADLGKRLEMPFYRNKLSYEIKIFLKAILKKLLTLSIDASSVSLLKGLAFKAVQK